MQDSCTIWVCQDCMLHHCNGECSDCVEDLRHHDREPMGLHHPKDVTMGMLFAEHSYDCKYSESSGMRDQHGCLFNCEYRDYVTSPCEGCGSTLHGERHAMTLWFEN